MNLHSFPTVYQLGLSADGLCWFLLCQHALLSSSCWLYSPNRQDRTGFWFIKMETHVLSKNLNDGRTLEVYTCYINGPPWVRINQWKEGCTVCVTYITIRSNLIEQPYSVKYTSCCFLYTVIPAFPMLRYNNCVCFRFHGDSCFLFPGERWGLLVPLFYGLPLNEEFPPQLCVYLDYGRSVVVEGS